MPDRIGAGTYLVAAAATGGCITVEGADAGHLGLVLDKLSEAGVDVLVDADAITADMTGKRPLSVDVITALIRVSPPICRRNLRAQSCR